MEINGSSQAHIFTSGVLPFKPDVNIFKLGILANSSMSLGSIRDNIFPPTFTVSLADTVSSSASDSVNNIEVPIQVQKALTQYNASVANNKPDASVFNNFLPLRKWLEKNQPAQLKAYDAMVQDTLGKIKVYETNDPLNTRVPSPQKDKTLVEDAGKKYLIVAKGIMELYFYRPEVIDKTVMQTNPKTGVKMPLSITINNSNKGETGGVKYGIGNQIAITSSSFWNQLQKIENNSLILTHEFSHDVDASDGICDGIPNNLINNEEDKTTYLKARDHLFELFSKNYPIYGDSKINLPTYAWESESGMSNEVLRHYAFKNDMEYWGVLAQTFLENPALLANGTETKDLYKLLVKYFKFDPLALKNKNEVS